MTILKSQNPSNPKRTLYLGNMMDMLQLVNDTKIALIAQYGVEEGTDRFNRMSAKDVLDRNSIDLNSAAMQ